MTMRETALALARRGFLVFPIKPGAKAPPLIPAWQTAATSAEAQVTSWWTQWPDANIGIHCDGLLVIDVDPKKGGYESLDALNQKIELYATLEIETPSGGRHIYYRCGDSIRNGVDVLGSGLDVRTKGGYVVGPGSTTGKGGYRVIIDEEICEAPVALADRLRASDFSRTSEQSDSATVSFGTTDADAAVERARTFLRTHPVAVEGEGGDHHTFATICRVRDFGVEAEAVIAVVGEWNARCVPPWGEDELTVKINNAYSYAQNPAGKLTPEALGFEVVETTQLAYTETQIANSLLHPADAQLAEVLGNEYLIKGVLERQSNAVLFGQWNAGKTFVVLDMAASIACGLPWFGRRVKQSRVLYLGYEGIRAMKKRIIALRDKYPMLRVRSTPFAWSALRNPLTTDEGNRELIDVLVEFSEIHKGAPDLVVIDPLANALGGDDSDAGLMVLLNRRVAELMRAQKCTVLRVHHSGHGNQERARGHSSLPAGVDTEIRVTEQEITLTKQRDDVRSGFYFDLEVKTLGKDSDGDPVTTCVIVQIEENALDPKLSRTQREYLDALIKLRGPNGLVSPTDLKDCAPAGTEPVKRREMQAALERKLYLRAEGKGFVIAERGSMEMFD